MSFNRPTLTIAEFEDTREFKRLNEQQQAFLRTWIETGGDQFAAFDVAYSAPNAETARRGSYAVMHRAVIQEAIATFLKKNEREKFIDEVTRVSRNPNLKPSVIRALELRAMMQFGVDIKTLQSQSEEAATKCAVAAAAPAPVSAPTQRVFKVGDVINYRGQQIRVTELNEKGQPVKGDPIEETAKV